MCRLIFYQIQTNIIMSTRQNKCNMLQLLICVLLLLDNRFFIDLACARDNYSFEKNLYKNKTPVLSRMRKELSLIDLLNPPKTTRVSEDEEPKTFEDSLNNWTGRWFPEENALTTSTPNALDETTIHSVSMGTHKHCDDGKTNLTVDWDNSPINYTCNGPDFATNTSIKPKIYCENIPPYYRAIHKCMSHTIEYDDDIPMYGTHRPVWPVYGEYKFIPRQRWIHSLEHGAIVMLYHPCAKSQEVMNLKNLVTKCLRRHIITAYSLLDEERPLALVAWGCRLTMSEVNEKWVKYFIMNKALKGPEPISTDGQFTEGLINKAKIVIDEIDSQICPSSTDLQ